MTIEEAKDYIREWCPYDRQEEIIKALEQEPCEDAVSRADTLQSFESYCEKNCQFSKKQRDVMCGACMMGDAIEIVESLPPVTPKQRTGKWMPVENDNMEVVGHYCSVCDLPMETEEKSKFCPNCGAKMGGMSKCRTV